MMYPWRVQLQCRETWAWFISYKAIIGLLTVALPLWVSVAIDVIAARISRVYLIGHSAKQHKTTL
jgi:hypothetical protein